MAPSDGDEGRTRLRGTVALLAAALLRAGARPDPDQPPVLDATSTRSHYATYPVVFAPALAADGAPAR
jgi:hypothetical protein